MKTLEYSVLHVPDLHGRIWGFEQAVEQFEEEKLDKLVFMGDYVDSKEATDIEIKYLVEQIIQYKKKNPQKVILLLGNHIFCYVKYFSYICV